VRPSSPSNAEIQPVNSESNVAAPRSHPRRQRPTTPGLRQQLYEIIFEADTFVGRLFDILLLIAILLSVVVVSLETVPAFSGDAQTMRTLSIWEWCFTGLFALEYALRLSCVRHPFRYAFSFWGVIDLLSFLPSLMIGLGSGERSFVILRTVRLLRVFRVLKLWRMMREAESLSKAVWHARDKIIVFIGVVLVAVTISGTLMYHVENWEPVAGEPPSSFTSIPQAMYWAIVTMTTVGYGDIVPTTTVGKFISAALILLGYSLIIVPSGFVIAEVSASQYLGTDQAGPVTCPRCARRRHAADANYCCRCGERLAAPPPDDA
jgi:voltage-gated potassium channel